MKKILTLFIAIIVMLSCVYFIGCSSKGTKYNLTSVTGLTGVSVKSFEYNYIELKDDGTYYIENEAKINGIVTKQSGKYLIMDDGEVILSDSDNGNNFLLASGEKITCINGKFVVSTYISGYGNVTMVYES